MTKVTSPIVGMTKPKHIQGAVDACDLKLSAGEIAYLEEPYIPHKLVGVMVQNTLEASNDKQVWSIGDQKI